MKLAQSCRRSSPSRRKELKLGFWHTGYMEFHEAPFTERETAYVPPPLRCPECRQAFSTEAELLRHRLNRHSYPRPALLLLGRECDRTRNDITMPTAPRDWTVVDSDAVRINGDSVDVGHLATVLSGKRNGVVSIELSNAKLTQAFELRFAVPAVQDLAGVDALVNALVRGRRLDRAAIDNLAHATKSFVTAREYSGGIATYLYGVLAREGSPESDLRREDYRGHFEVAVQKMDALTNGPAQAVRALVAFHFNQFEDAAAEPLAPWVAAVASRLARLLSGAGVRRQLFAETLGRLDEALADKATAQVLRWCSTPLDGSARSTVDEIEDGLLSQEPYDQVKLRVVAAEHHFVIGDLERGLRHANELRNNSLAENWARGFIARTRREADHE